MNIFARGARLTRGPFWIWMAMLSVAKAALFYAASRVPENAVLSAFDLVIVIMIAAAVTARFRDAGWPAWPGGIAVVLLAIVLPFAGFFAIAGGRLFPPASVPLAIDIMTFGMMGLLALLIAVAGAIPGRAAAQ
jgi:uncharacterized membrane protein YhaH (DUF805 family)